MSDKKTHAQLEREAHPDPPEVDVFFDALAHGMRADVPIIYLVWGVQEVGQGIKAELRAVTSYRARAEIYKIAIERENERRRNKYVGVEIEQTWLNHLYGRSMMQAMYDIEHDATTAAVLAEEESRK